MAIQTKVPQGPAPTDTTGVSIASMLDPVARALFGNELPVRIVGWDGSELPSPRPVGTLHVRSPDALTRILWSPNELGLARAYVTGEIEVEGDLYAVVGAVRAALDARPSRLAAAREVAVAARRLGILGRAPAPPPEEARLRGARHSKRRDAEAISHHYDVGNDFYRLVLGPSMTYSCARFTDPEIGLDAAQAAKHELVCRKLGLSERPGSRLLDVGCGWGSMAIHAAAHHGASVVGITISEAQAELARRRVADAGVADRVEIRLQDYRDVAGERFDAISSIGMAEHVGRSRFGAYLDVLRRALDPGGRLLNHAISSVGGVPIDRRSFVGRYVFPDGELLDVGDTVVAMEKAGFEVRDVESLREHYARTLRAWVANLEAAWPRAVELVGERRARVWRLYMVGSAVGFAIGNLNVHQVLGVVPGPDGSSGMPPTRAGWEAPGGPAGPVDGSGQAPEA